MTRHEEICSWIGKRGQFSEDNIHWSIEKLLTGINYNSPENYRFKDDDDIYWRFFKLSDECEIKNKQIAYLESAIKELEQDLSNIHETLDHLRTELVNIKALGGN